MKENIYYIAPFLLLVIIIILCCYCCIKNYIMNSKTQNDIEPNQTQQQNHDIFDPNATMSFDNMGYTNNQTDKPPAYDSLFQQN